MVMLHIKFKWNESYNNMLENVLPLHGPPDGVKRSNIFFLKIVMLHIKLKGKTLGHWLDMVYLPPQGEFCRPYFS